MENVENNESPNGQAHQVSSLSTGGEGTLLEYRVAAYALTALLCHASWTGFPAPVESVRLQQRPFGRSLDDISVQGHVGDIEIVTEYQVKRTVSIAPSNQVFVDVVGQCLGALDHDEDNIARGHHQLGLVASGVVAHLTQLRQVTRMARAHADPIAFNTATDTLNRHARQRKKTLHQTIESLRPDLTDTDWDRLTWKILKALAVVTIDPEPHGREFTTATNAIRRELPEDSRLTAEQVFDLLVGLAQELGPQSATVDAPMLRCALERRGVHLGVAPSQSHAYARLEQRSKRFRQSVSRSIGGDLHVARQDTLQQILSATACHEAVILTGTAGAGKTVLGLEALETLAETGTLTLALSLTDIGGPLHQWEASLHLSLRDALAGAPIGRHRTILIDGAEQALTDGSRLLQDVLRAIPRGPSAPSWDVLLTCRDEAVDSIMTASKITEILGVMPHRFTVGDLTDDEISRVIGRFPVLSPVNRHGRSRRLLRRPYVADLLVRIGNQRMLPDSLLGEEDVVEIVERQLVRRAEGALSGQGEPLARYDIYLALARAAVEDALPDLLDGRDALARQGLVSDAVLVHGRGGYRFAHDILRDYAVVSWMLERGSASGLTQAKALRSHLRALRLWMQHLLVHEEDAVGLWTMLRHFTQSLADNMGSRWLDVPYEAMLHLGRPLDVLERLEAVLLQNQGLELGRLLDVVDRLGIVTPGEVSNELLLDVGLAAPVVRFLYARAQSIPVAVRRQAIAFIVRFQYSSLVHAIPLPAHAVDATRLADALRMWRPGDKPEHVEQLVQATAMLGDALDEESENFLRDYACNNAWALDVVVEDAVINGSLAEHRPDLLLALSGAYYIDTLLTLNGGTPIGECREVLPDTAMSPRGVALALSRIRDHSLAAKGSGIPPLVGAHLGPFQVMLTKCPAQACRLIGALVDMATDERISEERDWGEDATTVELALPMWAQPRLYHGTTDIWCWYRGTSVGSFPAKSALLAMRGWAVEQVNGGQPVDHVVGQILQSGDSLALVAVSFSVLVQFLDRLPEAIDQFLEHPAIWHMEFGRIGREAGGMAFPADDAPRMALSPVQIAMELVLRGGPDAKPRWQAVGAKLRENPEPIPIRGSAIDGLSDARQRWADSFDGDNYQMTKTEDGNVQVSVGTVEATGRNKHILIMLESARLAFEAMQARDGGDGDAVQIWTQVTDLLHDVPSTPDAGAYPISLRDTLAAAASAVLIQAARGTDVPDDMVAEAAEVLLVVADDVGNQPVELRRREMAWGLNADLSSAAGLSVLVTRESIRERSQVHSDRLQESLQQLALSVFKDVRQRLSTSLAAAWNAEDPFSHEVSLEVARQLLATSFLAPWEGTRPVRGRATLQASVEEALCDDAAEMMLDSAADAIPLLTAAEKYSCPHSGAATVLLDALANWDLRVWPGWVNANYPGSDWRRTIDRRIAARIVDGERCWLVRYLAAFEPVCEELASLFEALAEVATTADRVKALHEIWNTIWSWWEPDRRSSDANYRDVRRLRMALLPILPDGAPWPIPETSPLFWRWVTEFADQPHVADHCIKFLIGSTWLQCPAAVDAVLAVLGEDYPAISRESTRVIPWLEFLLVDHPEVAPDYIGSLQRLLDALAMAGNRKALSLQRRMES